MPDHPPKKIPHHYRFWGFVIIGLLLIAAIWGIASRLEAASRLKEETRNQAIPTVAVMQVPGGPSDQEIILPGSVQAWHEAPIYARTNGYVKAWATDIGTHVKTGDLLAEIETPEIDAQTRQAEADLGTAGANNQLAQTTAQRWAVLLKSHSVSKQEAEEKFAAAAAAEAAMASAKANLEHLKQLEDFKHVVAPFDGIITARNTDVGALINAGSSGTGPELFHIAETDKLRIYTQVPEYDATYITPDLVAKLRFAEYPRRDFAAAWTNSADAIDPAARTLLIQLQVDNTKGELMPGSYTEVHIKIPANSKAVRLPVNTLLFRDEMEVATVDADGKALLKNITIGRDYGKDVEVLSGVDVGETIIVNPPDSLTTGQKVKIAQPSDKKSKDDKFGDQEKKQP